MTELEHLELALLRVKLNRDLDILTNTEFLDLIIDEVSNRNLARTEPNTARLEER